VHKGDDDDDDACFETYVSGYWKPLVLEKILTFFIVCIVSKMEKKN